MVVGSPGGGEGPFDTDPPAEGEGPDSRGGGPVRCGTMEGGSGGSDSWDAGEGPIHLPNNFLGVVESCVRFVPPSTLENAFGPTDPSCAGHAGGMGSIFGLPPRRIKPMP